MAVGLGSFFLSGLPASPLAVHLADDHLLGRREVAVLQPRTEVVQPSRSAAPAAALQPCQFVKKLIRNDASATVVSVD
jgi:hypothetical protein